MKLLVNFYANVMDKTVNDFIRMFTQVSYQQTQKNQPLEEIIIQISSSGGSSDHGLLAYNFLKQTGLKITTIGMGNVDSAAIMIYSAGENRLSVSSCRFLIHEANATIGGIFNANKLKELTKITERINEEYCSVISKVCDKKLNHIKTQIKKSKVMSAQEAKKFGLVNKIIEEPYLKDTKNILVFGISNPQQTIQSRQKSVV